MGMNPEDAMELTIPICAVTGDDGFPGSFLPSPMAEPMLSPCQYDQEFLPYFHSLSQQRNDKLMPGGIPMLSPSMLSDHPRNTGEGGSDIFSRATDAGNRDAEVVVCPLQEEVDHEIMPSPIGHPTCAESREDAVRSTSRSQAARLESISKNTSEKVRHSEPSDSKIYHVASELHKLMHNSLTPSCLSLCDSYSIFERERRGSLVHPALSKGVQGKLDYSKSLARLNGKGVAEDTHVDISETMCDTTNQGLYDLLGFGGPLDADVLGDQLPPSLMKNDGQFDSYTEEAGELKDQSLRESSTSRSTKEKQFLKYQQRLLRILNSTLGENESLAIISESPDSVKTIEKSTRDDLTAITKHLRAVVHTNLSTLERVLGKELKELTDKGMLNELILGLKTRPVKTKHRVK